MWALCNFRKTNEISVIHHVLNLPVNNVQANKRMIRHAALKHGIVDEKKICKVLKLNKSVTLVLIPNYGAHLSILTFFFYIIALRHISKDY